MSKNEPERGTLAEGEPHPMAHVAHRWIATQRHRSLSVWQEALSSSAIEGNRAAEVCSETLRRLMAGEPVSDRYVLGLAWMMLGGREVTDEQE